MKTIRDIDVEGKTVLVRVDFNVPMSEGKVTSDLRIRAALPTLEYLKENGAKKIVVMSHLGRPKGRDETLTMEPVAAALGMAFTKVSYVPEVSGEAVRKIVGQMKDGQILVLENLRFYPGEEANDVEFVREILKDTAAEVYVMDAFAVMHREHATVVAAQEVAREMGVEYVYGLLVEKEVTTLLQVMETPRRPFVMIIGGAKVEDKAPLIDKFAGIADRVIVGGKIAADGYISTADNVYVAEDFDLDADGSKVDVGPLSMTKVADAIVDAETVVWNGLMGKAEDPAYATASTIVAEMMGEKTTATTVVCGGDTTGFVEELMEEHPSLDYTLLSTGGGAALEFLLNGTLIGL